jgi:hypothetical protein
MTLESTIEAYVVKRVKELGGFSLKTDTVAGRRFVDRTCFLPLGRVVIFELKRPVGGHRRKHQIETVKRLMLLGHEVHFAKTKAVVDAILVPS